MKTVYTLLGMAIVTVLTAPALQATPGPTVNGETSADVCPQVLPHTGVAEPPDRLREQIWSAFARMRQLVIDWVYPDTSAKAAGTRVRKQMQSIKQAAQAVRNRVLEIKSAPGEKFDVGQVTLIVKPYV